MPTYEYECPEGHRFEKFQKMTDKPRAKCPVCGKPATRKISGGAGARVQGQRLLHHRLRQGRQGPAQGRSRRSRPPSRSPSHAKARRQARRQERHEGRSQAGRRRPPPSERRASRRAREGGLAARRRRGGVRARAAARRRPRRPRDQPRHGARQARARQSPEDRRARARGAAALPGTRGARPRSPGPGFINFWLAQDQLASAHRADPRAGRRRTAGAPPAPGSTSTSSSSPPIPPGRSTWATAAAPRWATRIAALLEWTGHARHPRVLHQRRRRPDRPAGRRASGPACGSWPASRRRFPRAATTANTSRENAREVLDREGPALRRPARGGGRAAQLVRSRSGSSATSRIATSPTSASVSTSCRSEQAIYDSGRVERALAAAARARAHLRGRRRALAPHHGVRRRQGPRAPEERRQLHLPRARHRLPHRQARSRLRPRHRRLGRGSSRLHPPDARRARRPSATRRSSSTSPWCSWSRWCAAGKR